MGGETMKHLNKDLLNGDFTFPADLEVPSYAGDLPEKVIQFGEGNFLRAFVDWMFHRMNKVGLLNGRVVVVQPLPDGMVSKLNQQDGLYTLILRGIKEGRAVEEKEIITSVSRGINPYTNWEEYLRCAENPDIEFVISNTTEAGIVYDPGDRPDDRPPASFPGKLTAYLYHRFKHFAGDPHKGMVIIPCELIDRNGDNLKKIVLQLAGEWGLPAEFRLWIEKYIYFLNTLVDRVVPGYPRDEIHEITGHLGYRDQLVDTGELFHLWVIEGPRELSERLPFTRAGLNVIWTGDMSPYRMRKVRILNGAHTAAVPAAFLYGLETVGEMVDHQVLGRYTREIIFDEIIPSIDLDEGMLKEFAHSVLERFQNPYIKHYLSSILLNSTSKYKTRVLPSLLGYIDKTGQIPGKLSFSMAALMALYRGNVEGTGMKSRREQGEFVMQDDPEALAFFQEVWAACDNTRESVLTVTRKVLGNTSLWGRDLNQINGLTEKIAGYLEEIINNGIKHTIARTITTQ